MTEPSEITNREDIPFFSGAPMHNYFCRMAELGPSIEMPPSPTPIEWGLGESFALPESFDFEGEHHNAETFFSETDTAALLVLHNGKLRFERYALTGGPNVPWLSMSVAKSFVSALVGIALEEGSITSLDDQISSYFEVTPGSAYDGVSIRAVLQMSSGARWNEDYSDPESDIFRLAAAMNGRGTFDEFVATSAPENPPGTVCRYNSADTQALTSLLVGATGRTLADYLHDKLLAPLGTTAPGHWLTDTASRAGGFFGLNLTARDFARLGELYRNGGLWKDRQLVPQAYVADSVRSTAQHTEPGQVWVGDHQDTFGYGYQWWLPAGDQGEFTAIGVYNQFIYVHPPSGAVIVKLSSNRRYGTSIEEEDNKEQQTLEFLRSIACKLG